MILAIGLYDEMTMSNLPDSFFSFFNYLMCKEKILFYQLI